MLHSAVSRFEHEHRVVILKRVSHLRLRETTANGREGRQVQLCMSTGRLLHGKHVCKQVKCCFVQIIAHLDLHAAMAHCLLLPLIARFALHQTDT